ncbi:uncharacterized protein LOC101746965 isoform X1 [Bombyx mori]|uniref:XK-related protein n=1 Tax=Bombyx mori TaxID=7091 RepID=A0A8R2GDD8_BOMMO|nr:uncharacterized protein LOC101746965 isoform X1 [Bombyx mori]
MAEVCKTSSGTTENKLSNTDVHQDENFCLFNVLCVFISLVSILADVTTDIIVFAEYFKNDRLEWAAGTIILIIIPNIIINVFSLRWLITDNKSNVTHWISHIFLVGLLERYFIFIRKVFGCKNLEAMKTNKLISQRNDLSLLHFIYIFTGTAPQIILQLYAIVVLDENYYTKVFSLSASMSSVVWGCSTYIYNEAAFLKLQFEWKSLGLRLTWFFGMLISRISGILLFTIVFGVWTLLPLSLHWTAMIFWIIIQKTSFCSNKLEETFYNVVMGFVYCFCYVNLHEGQTKYRLLTFYTLMVTQNFGSLLLYLLISPHDKQRKLWSVIGIVCIIFGVFIGICAMIFYYRFYHPKGPLLWKRKQSDIELNNKAVIQNPGTEENKTVVNLNPIRSFKHSLHRNQNGASYSIESTLEQHPKKDIENANKNFLLDQWIAKIGVPTLSSGSFGNNGCDASGIEIYSVENTPQTLKQDNQGQNISNKINCKHKKILICSPTELTLKLSAGENIESNIDEITSSNLNSNKRRAICSSDDLSDDLTNMNFDVCAIVNEDIMKILKNDQCSEISHDTDSSNKKTSSDSIDMDLDLSFSDINSSDINTFNENIVQKLCLSALKNIKVGNQDADIENIQRIALDILKEMYAKKGKKSNANPDFFTKSRELDTPTEILSVHDYENICAVNIAREAWGLRSWKGYCDIENWRHDGSVVRDRRRDTLTSASSEISSCISQELKNAILAAPPFPKKTHTYSNVFVKFDKGSQDDYANSTICTDDSFSVVDANKDAIHLEPIMEELDDLTDMDITNKKRLNSESSLVATIDEIRKSTVTNSPRNLYHRGDHLWDSPQPTASNLDPILSEALWKEPSKFHPSNIMESLAEKENDKNISQNPSYDTNRKTLNVTDTNNSKHDTLRMKIENNFNNHSTNYTRSKMKNLKTLPDPDVSNKNIDLLWQLVSGNATTANGSNDYVSMNRMSTSLQSLIQKDVSASESNKSSSPKLSNIKKQTKTKPRRKFSILREKFEMKTHLNSDEENLCNTSESTSKTLDVMSSKNNYRSSDKVTTIEKESSTYWPGTSPTGSTSSNNSNCAKEKRSLFMKQVLSPSKSNTKMKHKG